MRCRVLATDVQERSMVATVRSLTEAGFRVTAVGSGRLAPGLWTQGLEQRRLAPDARRDQEGFVRTLEQILVRNDHDVLLPGTDVSLLTVSRHRDRLAPYVNL